MTLPGDGTAADLPVLGWREWVALPELGVAAVKAKVDTGARTSSLHAFDLAVVRRDGRRHVRFQIHPVQRRDEPSIEAEALLVDEREIRSSNGELELRPVIHTVLAVAGRRHPIELTLARRDEMGFRMLLGREALRGRFLVDASASYRAGLDDAARAAAALTPVKDRR